MLISKFSSCNVQQRILDIEKQYHIVLPMQYRCFLYKYNGGHTPKTKFNVREDRGRFSVLMRQSTRHRKPVSDPVAG